MRAKLETLRPEYWAGQEWSGPCLHQLTSTNNHRLAYARTLCEATHLLYWSHQDLGRRQNSPLLLDISQAFIQFSRHSFGSYFALLCECLRSCVALGAQHFHDKSARRCLCEVRPIISFCTSVSNTFDWYHMSCSFPLRGPLRCWYLRETLFARYCVGSRETRAESIVDDISNEVLVYRYALIPCYSL